MIRPTMEEAARDTEASMATIPLHSNMVGNHNKDIIHLR